MSAILKDPLMQLRPMQSDDIDAVMEIERLSYEFPWTPGIFQDCLRVGYCCWVCVLGQRIISYGVMSVAVGEAHILNICVHPDFRGQRLALRMMHRLLNLARRHGADTAFLEVRESNRIALGLYASLEFHEIGRRRGYYPASAGREDAILLARNLVGCRFETGFT